MLSGFVPLIIDASLFAASATFLDGLQPYHGDHST
jgi:hypothetical protein